MSASATIAKTKKEKVFLEFSSHGATEGGKIDMSLIVGGPLYNLCGFFWPGNRRRPKTPAFAFLESVRPGVGSLCQKWTNSWYIREYTQSPTVKKPNSRKNPDLEYLEFFWNFSGIFLEFFWNFSGIFLEFFWNYLESRSRYYPC